jgi:trans-2,3-dihydro-3-hydroxyanthranilate isomerase
VSLNHVFTRDGVGGNHLGVVEDLAGLDTEKMQGIAADLGFSETVFIDDESDEAPLTRIFTPEMEMPFAGHPLVGAAWVMLGKESRDINRLRCGIGEVRIRREGEIVWVDAPMIPNNAQMGDTSFAAQVGLPTPVSSWRVDMPLDYRMVELSSAEAVSRVKPDTGAFGEAHGLTVFARAGDRVRMRFFIPEAGIEEDPATGSAAVALATMLAARGEETGSLRIDQGEEIGHPSRINLRWAGTTVSIGGTIARDEVRELGI